MPFSHLLVTPVLYQALFPTDELYYITAPPHRFNKSLNWQSSAANVFL